VTLRPFAGLIWRPGRGVRGFAGLSWRVHGGAGVIVLLALAMGLWKAMGG
jgi:hypothetical protein